MSFLASRRWRIFLIAWIVYTVHFATNVVREHYPAFSIAQHGTFRVDEYQGFHSDIFVHRDGHSVIGNQVLVSTLAAVPLFIFRPALDALQRYSLAKLAREGPGGAEYRTDKPMRVEFFRLVKNRGLDLRFGAATFITTAFFMAPITAGFLVFFYGVLIGRGLTRRQSTGLTFLLAFCTPIFFRTTGLNHNMFVMYGTFFAFALLWVRPGGAFPVSLDRRIWAGFWCGFMIATDYVSVVIVPVLYAYLVLPRVKTASWRTSIRESLPMIAGSVPPILFLLYSQWAMYGNPFLPGQYWMPDQNVYTTAGMRGFTWPAWDLLLQNLFHPGFGMYVWGPILLLALIPAAYPKDRLVLPARERWFVIACYAVLLIFCSMNQYARLQWNSGFRYLVPLVPLLVLALSDHWIRMPAWARASLAGAAGLHAWVLTVFREPVPQSWHLFLTEGPQLPWFRVFRMTSPPGSLGAGAWLIPAGLLVATLAVCLWIWRYGARLEEARARPA
jgi:hypothetical protein